MAETVQGSDWCPAFSMEIVKIRSGGGGRDSVKDKFCTQVEKGFWCLAELETTTKKPSIAYEKHKQK